jgi:hypothetical protein
MQTKKRTRVVTRNTYKSLKEPFVTIGPDGNIRSSTDLGSVQLSKLQHDIAIDGCDWLGSLAIHRYLKPKHISIYDDGDSFFSKSRSESFLFLLIFHHIYNIGLLKEPWSFPPFRTPINEKFDYMKTFLQSDQLPFGYLEEDLDKIVFDIQKEVKINQYKGWNDFLAVFLDKPVAEETVVVPTVVTDEERLEKLKTNCTNGLEILDFLRSPIDSSKIITNIEYDDSLKDDILDNLCHIVLEKLDQHTIFLQTGVKPIPIDWIRRLDLNIFST